MQMIPFGASRERAERIAALFLLLAIAFGCSSSGVNVSDGSGTGGGAAAGSTGLGGTGNGGTSGSGTGGATASGTGGATSTGTGGTAGAGSGGGSPAGNGGGTGGIGGLGGAKGVGGAAGTGSGGSPFGQGGRAGSGGAADAGVGGVGGESGSESDGGVAFDPCPPKGSACAIMPLGDSITEGYRSSDYGGYREPLFVLTLQDKKSITFVGSAPLQGPTSVDGVAFPRENEGVGGRTIANISALIPSTLDTNKPNVILLHIGTNDIPSGAASMTAQLGGLLDKILAAEPSALLVLAKIIPCKTDSTNVVIKAYDDSMDALVKSRAGAGKHIVLVDMYSAFTANASYKTALLYDEYHPRDAGYSVMAAVWYAPIRAFLP